MDLVGMMPAFVVAVVLISASPGPAMALILRRAAVRGFAGAVPTVLGLEAGLYLWALFAAAGLAAKVAASEVAFLVLRVVGAGFLLYLGIKAWRSAWRARGSGVLPDSGAGSPVDSASGWVKAFGEGALVMLANPKAAAFVIAFYPQFVPAGWPLFTTTAVLAVLQVAIEVVLYLTLAAVVGRASGWFRRSTVRRRLDAISGTVLVALGLRMATESR
ncbi:Threonine/homoserine/homoserine lactone efflux protein [Amycolatopsis arida]|uniref:Threonine/homoserine/homoserine lactone efflux protein n=1 Tax=Amycolatopsis arida TaxID=587909 RepID=A0A1I6AW70_9PSEU|nr:LysE family translocator [Amycolatopsis arida]TDX85390.1 threonine/homoserine/homoserine lactone efflux protein [Amycolatopsis arida]SFQ72971.1 Threonine/homoserine/homoserine lactone efflux protein [Amycolatopsis arida]